MDNLIRKQEESVYILHHIRDEKVTQHILEVLGKENQTRDISSGCDYLTDEQEDLFESLGRGYTFEELEENLHNDDVKFEISEKLKEQGVTKFLYENDEYLEEVRKGNIICEGIDIKEIKKNLNLKQI